MKKYVALALAVLMLLSLCACGDSDGEKAVYGTYDLYAVEYDTDVYLFAEEFFSGKNYVNLKSGGIAEMCLDDEVAKVKWKIDGSKLTLSAADGDMEGTVENGILAVNVNGTNLLYVAEGASTAGIHAISLSDYLNGVFDDAVNDAMDDLDAMADDYELDYEAAAETEVQKLWNGWWYGAIDINGSTNGWEWLNGTTFAGVMHVVLDEDGYGTLTIHDPNGELVVEDDNNKFADIQCHADTLYLYGDSGTSFGYDINTSDWTFVRFIGNDNKIGTGSSFTDSKGNKLGYDFIFMPWGSRWEDDEAYAAFIPGFEDYLACIEAGQTEPFADNGGEKPGLLGNNPVKQSINDRDIVFVYYPGDLFEYNDSYGKIRSKTGSVSILFDPMLGSTNYEEYKKAYKEKYASEDDYSLTETTVNGYKAMVMKYSDWLGSSMYVDVDFGGSHNGYYGMCFNVSADSLAECDTDLVWAIIESFELAQ